jgi:hypothetical protein
MSELSFDDIKLIVEKLLTLPIIALALNFFGALFLTLSSGQYKGKRPVFFSGERNLVLNHPRLFRFGLLSIVIGFLIQLINEILKSYRVN